MKKTNSFWSSMLGVLALLIPLGGIAQQDIPTPKSHFGFNIGDDYHLANFTQTEAYFKKLDASSDRLQLIDIGETEEGRRQYMFVVSAPENLKNLTHYQEISQKMARAEISEEDALSLSQTGKPVVWIDGGLHSSETVAMHQLIELAYQLASRNDAETKFILENTIILLVHANPDGQEMVGDWYMRKSKPESRSLSNRPIMYHKYIGHDNNRDFFMLNMKESQNIARQLFVEWVPQVMYNHHQTAPAGVVVAGAPYRDPHNYVFDPLLMTSIDALGAAIHSRLNREGKPGYTQRGGSVFSTWYNGGLRTTTYFHNIVGLLTETIGGPNPFQIPLVPHRLLPNGDTPNPIVPQRWHFQQSIDYSMTMNYAVLNYAARHGDELLINIYQMGRSSIERGSKDHWSFSPKKVAAITASYENSSDYNKRRNVRRRGIPRDHLNTVIEDPTLRDPRGYIIPSDQEDFPTAVKFLNALIGTGIIVHEATSDFIVEGKHYPSGSYIVKTAQAFRPHVLDMFEPQDHPNDFQYEGGPPIRPYDAAGWTPAFLMNVKFDRHIEDFDGPFKRLPIGEQLPVPNSKVPGGQKYFHLSSKSNDSYKIVNGLLAEGVKVERDSDNGDFVVEANPKSTAVLTNLVEKTGVRVSGGNRPSNTIPLKQARIGLWDRYGGSMPSGWIRWISEQYGYGMEQVFVSEINRGNLNKKYDVLIFVGGAIPTVRSTQTSGNIPEDIPQEHHYRWGRITAGKSIPALRDFLNKGGKIITIGSSANLAYHLDLPVKNALVETVKGRERALPSDKYFTPGSVLTAKAATDHSANWGADDYIDVYFNRSPVFRLDEDAVAAGRITPLLWFDTDSPLKSGWSWGQSYLKDGVAAFEAPVGNGKLYVFGPEITFRAQAHGTFKLLFNQLYN